jgi:hypothetical protein
LRYIGIPGIGLGLSTILDVTKVGDLFPPHRSLSTVLLLRVLRQLRRSEETRRGLNVLHSGLLH